jgi:hypothetical protein
VSEPVKVASSPSEVLPNDIARAPFLAFLAAIAAFLDLAVNRIAVNLIDTNRRELWLPLVQHGAFPRALGAICAFVIVATMSYRFLSMAGFAPVSILGVAQRLSVALVAGMFIPSMAIMFFMPERHLATLIVLLAMLSANGLCALLTVASFSYVSERDAWPSVAAGLTGLLAILSVVVSTTRLYLPESGAFGPMGWIARQGSELLWLITPLLALRSVRGGPRAWVPFVSVVLTVLALGVWLQLSHGSDAARIAYAAFRITTLPARLTALYAIPLAFSLGYAVSLLSDQDRRQLGLGILLWVFAGLAPRSPAAIAYQAAAALLLARAAQSAHPVGRERVHQTWFNAEFEKE